jgi:hypothetical protein
VATIPGYGAPGRDERGDSAGDDGDGDRGSGGGSASRNLPEKDGGAVSAVTGAASDSGVAILAAALLALTLGAVALGRSRRGRS